MGRIARLLRIWKSNWDENPGARGAAKMAAGVALILEGFLGMRARVKGNSGGLIAVLFLIVFGTVFFAVGYFVKPKPFVDEIPVQGTIVDSQSHMSNDSDGKRRRMYKAIYAYEVDGKNYRFPSSVSSSSVPRKGEKVKLAYSKANPDNARRVDGMDGKFHWIFQGAGLLIILSGLYQLAICLLLIGAGIALFYTGRQDRALAGNSEGFFKDLFSLIRDEKTQRMTLAGGASGGIGSMVENALSSTTSSSGVASSSMPPAGWMLDPEDSGQMRWWDGAAWTDMRKPIESAKPGPTDSQGW